MWSHEYLQDQCAPSPPTPHFHACSSRNTTLLATASSPYFPCSCSRAVESPDISRSSSQMFQSGPEPGEFTSNSRASVKSPLVFSRALVTLTRSWNTNGDVRRQLRHEVPSLSGKILRRWRLRSPAGSRSSAPPYAVCRLLAESASVSRWRRRSPSAAG